MTALAHFREHVRDLSHVVAKRRWPTIEKLFGERGIKESHDSGSEVDDFYENREGFVGTMTDLGSKGMLYFGVYWHKPQREFGPFLCVSYEAPRKLVYDRLARALERVRGTTLVLLDETWEVAAEARSTSETAKRFESQLGHLSDTLLQKLAAVEIRKLLR